MVRLLALSVILPEFLLVFLVIGFASGNKILEEHAVVNDLDVEDEEGTETADADAINIVIVYQLLAIGDLFQA